MVPAKETRTTQGVKAMALKGKNKVYSVEEYKDGMFAKADKYRTKNIPAVGTFISTEDKDRRQTKFED